MENQKDKQKVQTELEIKDIQLNQNEKGEVIKIRFVSDKGDITFKPKLQFKNTIRGFSILGSKFPTFAEMSEKMPKLIEFSEKLNKNGFLKVKASFILWETLKDNIKIYYRYIQGLGMFNEWELIKERTPVEKVN